MATELVIYTDESKSHGLIYGNFYGGALVRSKDLLEVDSALSSCIKQSGLTSEIKWTNITASVESRYIEIVNCFFELIKKDKVKVRVMFTQSRLSPQGLSREQINDSYWILYYQFLKHSFGLQHHEEASDVVNIRLMIDQMPGTKWQRDRFKSFIIGLNNTKPLQGSGVQFRRDQIAEIDSSKHSILQCLDVVLGSMHFRLNHLHKAIPDGQKRRGNRTKAKEAVYKQIQTHLSTMRPHFNIGESTGKDRDIKNIWRHSYRHWKFVPQNHKVLEQK